MLWQKLGYESFSFFCFAWRCLYYCVLNSHSKILWAFRLRYILDVSVKRDNKKHGLEHSNNYSNETYMKQTRHIFAVYNEYHCLHVMNDLKWYGAVLCRVQQCDFDKQSSRFVSYDWWFVCMSCFRTNAVMYSLVGELNIECVNYAVYEVHQRSWLFVSLLRLNCSDHHFL